MIRSLAWDLGLPVVTYYALHAVGAEDTTALLAGTLAAGARLAWAGLRERSLSPFSAVMVGLSTVLSVVTFASLAAWTRHYIATHKRAVTPVPATSSR